MSGRNVIAALVLGFAAFSAQAGPAEDPPAAAGVERGDITLAELGRLGCAPGLERCPGGAPAATVLHRLDGFAGSLFEGLEGQVTVGPLSPGPDGR